MQYCNLEDPIFSHSCYAACFSCFSCYKNVKRSFQLNMLRLIYLGTDSLIFRPCRSLRSAYVSAMVLTAQCTNEAGLGYLTDHYRSEGLKCLCSVVVYAHQMCETFIFSHLIMK